MRLLNPSLRSLAVLLAAALHASCGGGTRCDPVDDGDPCTLDVCDDHDQPAHSPAPAGTACTGSQPCIGAWQCDGAGACACASALPLDPARVAPPLDPTQITPLAQAAEFLYTGPDPIQRGVRPGAIEARRVVVLRGRVLAPDGAPAPGALIRIAGHDELGTTLSRTDGAFDLVANGGGLVVVDYSLSGHLPAQRQVQTPWQDFVQVPDVVLQPLDARVTEIRLGPDAPPQTARGSVSLDADGARQGTLIFPSGTQAGVTRGGASQALPTAHVRVTEYTVGPRGPLGACWSKSDQDRQRSPACDQVQG